MRMSGKQKPFLINILLHSFALLSSSARLLPNLGSKLFSFFALLALLPRYLSQFLTNVRPHAATPARKFDPIANRTIIFGTLNVASKQFYFAGVGNFTTESSTAELAAVFRGAFVGFQYTGQILLDQWLQRFERAGAAAVMMGYGNIDWTGYPECVRPGVTAETRGRLRGNLVSTADLSARS